MPERLDDGTPVEPERASAHRPDADPPEDRRDFLVSLGKMTFLTAAVVKLGVSADAEVLDYDGDATCKAVVLSDGADKEVLDTDARCNTPSCEKGDGVWFDTDCGKEKSDGDNDCGQLSGLSKTSTWRDNDCSVKNGPDNDCGKPQNQGGTWEDNDCAKGGSDNDCTKGKPGGGTWPDNDGS